MCVWGGGGVLCIDPTHPHFVSAVHIRKKWLVLRSFHLNWPYALTNDYRFSLSQLIMRSTENQTTPSTLFDKENDCEITPHYTTHSLTHTCSLLSLSHTHSHTESASVTRNSKQPELPATDTVVETPSNKL